MIRNAFLINKPYDEVLGAAQFTDTPSTRLIPSYFLKSPIDLIFSSNISQKRVKIKERKHTKQHQQHQLHHMHHPTSYSSRSSSLRLLASLLLGGASPEPDYLPCLGLEYSLLEEVCLVLWLPRHLSLDQTKSPLAVSLLIPQPWWLKADSLTLIHDTTRTTGAFSSLTILQIPPAVYFGL